MRKVILTMIALGTCICTTEAQDPARYRVAEEFVKVIDLEKTIDQTLGMMRKRMTEQIKMMHPGSDPTQLEAADKTMAVIEAEMSWDRLKEDYIKVYAETFTVEEMNGIIAFYHSPAGKAFAAKQPELNKGMMKISQKMMMRVAPMLKRQR
jgi:uncharacterized protein